METVYQYLQEHNIQYKLIGNTTIKLLKRTDKLEELTQELKKLTDKSITVCQDSPLNKELGRLLLP